MRASALIAGVLASGLATATAVAADPTVPQGADTWRASKLIGVPIYGPDTVSVGKIDDLVLTHDGRITMLVVGVGGFLGLGEKDVALPYGQVTFSATPIAPPSNPIGPADGAPGTLNADTAGGMMPTASPTAAVPAAGVGTGAATVASSAPPPPSTAYPDHGVIAMTKDELKALPTFQFAR